MDVGMFMKKLHELPLEASAKGVLSWLAEFGVRDLWWLSVIIDEHTEIINSRYISITDNYIQHHWINMSKHANYAVYYVNIIKGKENILLEISLIGVLIRLAEVGVTDFSWAVYVLHNC